MKPVPGPVEGWTFERSSAGLMIAITESGDWSTCVGIDGGTLTVFTGRPEVRIPIAVVRALLADEALTVGQALADERFQDTTHVAEGGPDGRIQWRARGDENGADVLVRQWRPAAKRWRPWSMLSVNADQFAWPARLVPLADADASPESRGSM